MLLNLLQQFDIALTDFLTILLACGLGLFFILGGLCLPLAALVTEGLYTGNRKAFYDKCALQMAQSAFASAMFPYTVIGFCVAIALALFRPDLLDPPLVWRPVAGLGLPLAVLACLAAYVMSWAPLKKIRALHLLAGLVAALACLTLLFLGILLLGNLQQPMIFDMLWDTPLPVLQNLIDDFLLIPHQWFMLAFLILTGLVAGFSLAQLWVFIRRNKTDYGRDYYSFALRYCARGAIFFCLAATALGAFIFHRLYTATPGEFRQPADLGVLVVAYALPLVCCLLWFLMIKSDTPLRHKGGAFFACLFQLVALCAQLTALVSTFPLV
ncbi:hypothetical protein LJC09_02155 [Desulfovibrio sp. OttesenSCG-928-F20]|nr:hypothetical protein [Desulfovibrio sp. OttesenSCG-928-M16]MDL2290894.1 hypothetical protein [Desulfovibrio sp. OttesenSCG-928-F20]